MEAPLQRYSRDLSARSSKRYAVRSTKYLLVAESFFFLTRTGDMGLHYKVRLWSTKLKNAYHTGRFR